MPDGFPETVILNQTKRVLVGFPNAVVFYNRCDHDSDHGAYIQST